jgi:hydroxymethylbilane synthase
MGQAWNRGSGIENQEYTGISMIILGTRGSALALTQTEYIKARILKAFPDSEIVVRIIKTSADKDTTTSIRSGSAVGVFVKELEQALLAGEIDIAVHSMKDVPTIVASGLEIVAIPEREDARDAFLSNAAKSLSELPAGAVVGTGSVRRQAQLFAIRPDLKVRDIRGNIDTRLKKLSDGAVDALILACAGLNRLGYQNRISAPLDFEQMLPAPGQGALAVEMRAEDARARAVEAALNHSPTAIAVLAERSFLYRMGGGCNVPVAVHASLKNNVIRIEGLAASPDGKRIIRESIEQARESAHEAAISLAERILAMGGSEILADMP